jgi:hypothetical protein
MKLWQSTIRIGRPGSQKTDDELSESLVEREHMSKDAAKVVKQLYGDHLSKYSSAERAARSDHKRLTFPGIGNISIVVLEERQLWLDTMARHDGILNALADEFCDNYDLIIEAERLSKNGNFKIDDYPSRAAMRSRFSFTYGVQPMPEPNAFLTDAFTDDLGQKLAAEYEQRLSAVTEQVRRQVLNTMLSLVADTAESLASDGPIVDSENRKGPFAKLQQYLERVPALNVTNDPTITGLYTACLQKLSMSADRLRASNTTRQLAAARAADIAMTFGGTSRKLDLKKAA